MTAAKLSLNDGRRVHGAPRPSLARSTSKFSGLWLFSGVLYRVLTLLFTASLLWRLEYEKAAAP